MARRPRPVNPEDGPVQAFAFDLRVLRESAGNPTYRALARIAGYSATTLGDAAGGAQLPTLEVTAAYVGACGGDVGAWRARWQEVSRELASEQKVAVEAEVAAEEAPQETVEEPAPQQNRRRSYAIWTGVAVAIAGGLVAAATTMGNPSSNVASTATSSPASPGCPALRTSGASIAFTGKTYGIGANVRTGASLQSPVRLRVPAGCEIGFSGYCIGDVVKDETAGTPDMRWFIIPNGGGEVASAIVHGDPPSSLGPQPCPDAVPGPASISLAVSPNGTGGDMVELTASGSRLWIVGFAAYYASQGSGTEAWHQLGFGDTQDQGTFASSPLRLDGATSPVPVVAVACLGGQGPTGVVATGAISPAAPRAVQPMPAQYAASLPRAEQAACAYPGAASN